MQRGKQQVADELGRLLVEVVPSFLREKRETSGENGI